MGKITFGGIFKNLYEIFNNYVLIRMNSIGNCQIIKVHLRDASMSILITKIKMLRNVAF